jgi:uncharacterized protein (TIGR02996 family)
MRNATIVMRPINQPNVQWRVLSCRVEPIHRNYSGIDTRVSTCVFAARRTATLGSVPPSLDHLRARPRDREQLLVYADWLQARGDPRGELIAVQDLEATTTNQAQFEQARARARTLVEEVEQLRPPMPESGVWAVWERGFVRRLELSVDAASDWDERIATIMDHPSLALVEHLLIRVDVPGEQTEIALDIVIRGLARWRGKPGPRPPTRIDLWTPSVPRGDARERLVNALPELRPFWFSTDITVIPPPADAPTYMLDYFLRWANSYGHPPCFDLLWFDARGHFFARVEPHSTSDDTIEHESGWQVHVRRLAERRPQPIFDGGDPLVSRRLAHLFDHLAARFDSRGFAPRLAPAVAALTLDDGLARLEREASELVMLANATLQRFGEDVSWYWTALPCRGGQWTGLLGLGPEQVIVLAATPAPDRPALRSPHG